MKIFSLLAGCSVAAGSEWSWPEDDAWGTAECLTGTAQSPIAIPQYCLDNMVNSDAIAPSWGGGIMTEVSYAHGIQLLTPSAGPFTTQMRGVGYTMEQCHFHYGSEHTFGGEQSDLCMHCVHSKDGAVDGAGVPTRHGVLAFRWNIASSGSFVNPFLDQFVSVLDGFDESSANVQNLEIDLSLVLDGVNMREYIQYDGSLTTPPCSEAVDWHVLTHEGSISQATYDAFMMATGSFTADAGTIGNARTPQALGSRVPTGCTWTDHWTWPEDESWGQVADSVCVSGSAQSPINIPQYCLNNMNNLDAIVADWSGTNSHTVSYSHGVKVTPVDTDLVTTMRGQTYTLDQCHFHHGSEHTFGGDQSALCMHCVHTKNGVANRYGVLAFTWEVSATATSDPFLDLFSGTLDSMNLDTATHDDTYDVTDVDLGLVMVDQDLMKYIQYDGSLTTPPCFEVVDWHVLTHARPISQEMHDKIKAAIGVFTPDTDGTTGNARSPQPLNSRVPTGCEWSNSDSGGVEENAGDRVSPLWVLPLVSFVGSMV